MIKRKLCMLLITYKQIGDSSLTSRMNRFILIMAQSRDTIERKDLCVLVVPRNHSFRKPSLNLRESYSSRDARKRRILSHIGIVRTWAENGQAGNNGDSERRTFARNFAMQLPVANDLPEFSPSFLIRYSSRCFKIQRTVRKDRLSIRQNISLLFSLHESAAKIREIARKFYIDVSFICLHINAQEYIFSSVL